MPRFASPTASRPRILIHPGRFNPVRIQSIRATSARHFRLALQPGRSLFEALVRPLAEQGVENASTTILGGSFAQLHYCVAPPDPSKQAVIAYTSPIDAGRAYMIFGNATLGKSVENRSLVHCHAAIRTEGGEIKGGHILTEQSIIGADPISVLVTSFDEFELRQIFDPETNISLLQPRKQVADDYHKHC